MIRHTSLILSVLICCIPLVSRYALAQTPESQAGKTATRPPDPPVPIILPPAFPNPNSKLNPEIQKRLQEFKARVDVFWKDVHKHVEEGKLAEAYKSYQQAVALCDALHVQKDKSEIYFLGHVYLREGQNQNALNCFREVFPLGENPALYLDMALVYCRLDNFKRAQFLYISTTVQQSLSDFFRSDFFLPYGDDAKLSEESMPDVMDTQDLQANILLAGGIHRLRTGIYAEAIENFQAADKLRPETPLVHYCWALALSRLNKNKEAIPHFQFAILHGDATLMKSAKTGLAKSEGKISP